MCWISLDYVGFCCFCHTSLDVFCSVAVMSKRFFRNKKGIYWEVDSVDTGATTKTGCANAREHSIIQYFIFFLLKIELYIDNRDLSTSGSNFFEISKSGYLCQRLSPNTEKTMCLNDSEFGVVNLSNLKTYGTIFLKNYSE